MKQEGYNTNLASEFYVLSLLHRLGLDASLTLGNKKAVDLVVVRAAGDAVTIDVKAVAGKTDWLVGNPSPVPRANHFVVLVTYEGKFRDVGAVPRIWVLPHAEFLPLVKTAKPPSKMRYLPRTSIVPLVSRNDAWQLISGPPAV